MTTRVVPFPCYWFAQWLWSSSGNQQYPGLDALPWLMAWDPLGENLWHWARHYPKHRVRHSQPKSRVAPWDCPVGTSPCTGTLVLGVPTAPKGLKPTGG